jgi:hypothetical protein
MAKQESKPSAQTREERAAAAMRENLRRRKIQQQAREKQELYRAKTDKEV